jgi:hypothetical protein
VIRLVTGSASRKEQWNTFCDQHPQAWWWHSWEWLEYSTAYLPGASNLSVLIEDHNDVIGICPIVVHIQDGSISGGGAPLAAPLIKAGYSHEVYHALNLYLWSHVKQPFVQYRLSPLASQENYSLLHSTYGWDKEIWQSQVLDLTKPEDVLRKDLRKSYRSLINQQATQYNYEWVCGTDFWIQDMQQLHAEVSERQTRPPETWRLMGEWMKNGHAGAMVVRDKISSQVVAFIFILIYKNAAYYASGASTTSTHYAHWQVIRTLKSLGIRYYELGWQQHATDIKGANIEFFKKGFGGTTQPFSVFKRQT